MTSHAQPIDVVLITGGLGSGKTTTAIEIGEQLERARLPFAVLDLDWLCWAWSPSLEGDGLHELMCQNVRSVVPHLSARGCRHLVLTRAVLSEDGMHKLRDAVSPAPLRVVRLTTTTEHAVRRLRARESVGSDTSERLAALLAQRAAFEEMTATAAADARVIDTSDRDPATVAAEVLAHLGWMSVRRSGRAQ